MAFIEDPGRVAETTTGTGTGAITVLGAVAGYQRFSAKLSVGDTFPGAIVASDNTWQEGIFTYSALNQITFTTILDGSSGTSQITLPAGTHTVFAGFLGMGKTILNAPAKTTPAGADLLALIDSADSNRLKGLSITNLQAALSVGDHAVTVTTGNGHGSTNTAIRRFTTTQSSSGTAITYADSATLGASFTINDNGLYEIYYLDTQVGAAGTHGISLNSSQLTTSIASITATDRLGYAATANNAPVPVARVVRLAATDVIRPHDNTSNNDTSALNSVFSIRKVGT